MILANYISDLLYRYECVIVPNLGGFVTNKIGAKVDEHTFYPPTKQLSFNTHLKHNDGLLANHIAEIENISFEDANQRIYDIVEKWKTTLTTTNINIETVGKLYLNNEQQIIFEPTIKSNFLTSSFGLSSLDISTIKRVEKQSTIINLHPIETTEESKEKTEKEGVYRYIKYVATVSILLTIGAVSYYNFNKKEQQKEIIAQQQQKLHKKIEQATFVINNPLPTINLNIAKEESKTFHVIAGAFQLKTNAIKKVKILIKKGFNATILGKNKWGLTVVAYGSYHTDTEARKVLADVKKHDKEAWLFVKKTQN